MAQTLYTFSKFDAVWTNEEIFADNSSIALFDLTNDPYESSNLYDDDDYASSLSLMEERRSIWSNLSIEENTPNNDGKYDAWDICGRVCPWLQFNENTTISIEQLYDYSDAPNIVFILVDDWGYNDYGPRSTYMPWVSSTLSSLADDGILLTNYYTNELCSPSRASLLTGRYSLRLGVHSSSDELPITEVTLAQELKSAGYRTYIVGKWHLGQSSYDRFPTSRGFDYFYGYVNGYESYWNKEINGYVDLFENDTFVTDTDELSSDLHTGYLFQTKAEDVIKSHALNYPDTPMFLYYSMHLVHYPWTAPDIYIRRCMNLSTSDVYYMPDDVSASDADEEDYLTNFCAMNVMMDEAIANLTCTLSSAGLSENTVIVISGDNGGQELIVGSNYPFKGHKATAMRGAFANTAIVYSDLIPSSMRGSSYDELVHITDWLPTLMHLATDGAWTGSYKGSTIDGYDIWDNLLDGSSSGREEIVFYSSSDTAYVAQYNNTKYIYHAAITTASVVNQTFMEDMDSSLSYESCDIPSYLSSLTETTSHLMTNQLRRTGPYHLDVAPVLIFLGVYFVLSAFLLRKKISYMSYSNRESEAPKEERMPLMSTA